MRAHLLPLVVAGLLLAGCSREEKTAEAASAKKPEPVQIRTVAVETRKIDKTISVTGSLHPDETVSVSAEVPGRVSPSGRFRPECSKRTGHRRTR